MSRLERWWLQSELAGFIRFMAGLMFIVGSVMLVLGGFLSLIMKGQCVNYAELSGVRTSYRWVGGCYIHMKDGRVIPYDQAMRMLSNEYRVEMK